MTERNIHPDFSFDKVGKETPFRVPDGFFPQLETDILRKAFPSEPRKRKYLPTWRIIAGASVAAAATVALLISSGTNISNQAPSTNLSVEQAFNNLSQADQDYLIDTFRNDMITDY